MKGVLLMSYGSPSSLGEVSSFYAHIRGGVTPTQNEIENLKARYAAIGDSPLLGIVKTQASELERLLGRGWKVFIGMKHWKPFIGEVIKDIAENDIKNAVAIALAPHYSSISIGGYVKAVETANAALPRPLAIKCVKSWGGNHFFLKAVEEKLGKALEKSSADVKRVIFTAHSLPERILKEGDPYQREIEQSCSDFSSSLGIKDWQFAYQSAPRHPKEKWLGPDIKKAIEKAKKDGNKNVLVCPIGFTTDHLEILYDIDIEAKNYGKSIGIEVTRTESLNASPSFIKALCGIAKSSF